MFRRLTAILLCVLCAAALCSCAPAQEPETQPAQLKKYENQNEQYGIIGIEGLDVSFPTVNFDASINDVIICFSDGITDSVNIDNEDFKKDRIIKILKENAHLSSCEGGKKIMTSLESFTKGTTIHDDITLIVLKRNNSQNYIESI